MQAAVPEPPGPVLFAYDDSDGARHAIHTAAGLFDGAEALVLTVAERPPLALLPVAGPGVPVPPPELDSELEARNEENARAIAGRGVDLAAKAGFRARPIIARASGASGIARAILAAADEHDVGLIVVGSRGRTGIAAAILGSVANAVVHGTRRPTLTVPEDDDPGT